MNILHFVLGSKGDHYTPIEQAAKDTWFKCSPDNIKTIFMYGGSKKIYWDDEDSFYVDRPENHYYNICLYKTIKAFETFIETDFDYIYRTNNSGYFDLNLVNKFLLDAPKKQFYCGNHQEYKDNLNPKEIHYASGASYFLSRDIVEKIIDEQDLIYSYNLPGWCDDVAIGKYITEHLGICINEMSKRFVVNLNTIHDNIDLTHYHYRIEESSLGDSVGNAKLLYRIHELKYNFV
jgi:hypothetical protein